MQIKTKVSLKIEGVGVTVMFGTTNTVIINFTDKQSNQLPKEQVAVRASKKPKCKSYMMQVNHALCKITIFTNEKSQHRAASQNRV